eukprot:m.694924 g.694924  ORF g.694924 m.694924 type:complete len:710 (-) comp58667_c0_seq16:223-2352(-)
MLASATAVLALVLLVHGSPVMRSRPEVRHITPLTLLPSLRAHPMRRSIDNDKINLQVPAFNKNFDLNLHRSEGLFMPGVQFVATDDTQTSIVDMSDYGFYSPSLSSQPVLGSFFVTVGGQIQGSFADPDDFYHIEPAGNFYSGETTFDHVIYRLSDMESNGTSIRDAEGVDGPLLSQPDEHHAEERHRSRRGPYIPTRTTCGVAVSANSLFYASIGNSNLGLTVAALISRFNVGKNIFSSTSTSAAIKFDKTINIAISIIHVYTSSGSDPYYINPATNPTATDFLNLASATNWNEYCLAHVFTYHNFNGVLGLAWRGYTNVENRAGGICQLRLGNINYNTAITTQNNFGSLMSDLMTGLVFTHEIGHNMGTGHDATGTNSANGNYIMYPDASTGTAPNNDLFSQQSVDSIDAVVTDHGGCFVAPSAATCGNTIVESGEECDCGDATTCDDLDPCCSVYSESLINTNCELKAGADCSPLAGRDGACCNANTCARITSGTCAPAGPCQSAATCNSQGQCPTSSFFPDYTGCSSNTQLCLTGECTESLCATYGLTECFLTGSDACQVACTESGTCKKLGSVTASAIPNRNPSNIPKANTQKSNGQTCIFANSDPNSGFCSSGTCQSASGESELQQTLNNLADQAKADIASAVNWATESTGGVPNYAWLLIGLAILMVIGAGVNRYRDKLELKEDIAARNKKVQAQQMKNMRR